MGKDGLGFNIDTPNEIRIRELEKENAELKSQLEALQWCPITETDLPKMGDEILCWYASGTPYVLELGAGWGFVAKKD